MSATVRDVQGSPYLTDHIVGYAKELGLVQDRIAPVMEVDAEDMTFYVVPFDWGRRDVDDGRGEESPATEIRPGLLTGTFSTDDHALKSFLSDRKRDRAMSSPEGFKGITDLHAELPSNVVLLRREKLLASALNTTANYFSSAHYTTLTSPDQWNEYATSNPQEDIIAFAQVIHTRSGIPRRLLTLLIGSQVYDVLIQHPHVRKVLFGDVNAATPNAITLAALAQYFGVKEVIVGDTVEVTSKIGATTELTGYVWGKNAYLLYVDPNPVKGKPTSGSVVTVSTMGKKIPLVRTYRTVDPLGTMFVAEANYGIGLGRPTDEGLRTAARLASVIA